MKYLSIVSALVLMVCLSHSQAASLSGNDQRVAQQEVQKKESDDLDNLMDLDDKEPIAINDPIASWNRAMFELNDILYFYGLKPLARVWRAAIPIPFRAAIRNAFINIRFPIRRFGFGPPQLLHHFI